MKIKNIGFIGLGNMGYYMAKHLIKKKYNVYPYDISQKNLNKFNKSTNNKKLNFFNSIGQIDCIILMVPSSKEVKDIIFKEIELFKNLKKIQLLLI